MTAPLYIALLHYPVQNKNGEVVTTSVTNFDLHDLARTATTFGVSKCFIVTPNKAQQGMISYIKEYWREGLGSRFNPDRREAFECLEFSTSLEETCLTIKNIHGTNPKLIATTAKETEKPLNYKELRGIWKKGEKPLLIIFGTGWGLHESVFREADLMLEPIRGLGSYNHLPVRAAVAIVLDRLLYEHSLAT